MEKKQSPVLSVCLIVKNEEEVLTRCLTCAQKFADEIIVVDTGSTDSTKHIAARFTQNVFDFAWCDDFSAARNFSFSKAKGAFLMWLDADDVVTEENCAKINALKQTLNDYDTVCMPYAAAFDEENQPVYTYYRERIFAKASNPVWEGAVHEVIVPRGKILYTDACIYHKKEKVSNPMRNLLLYQKQIAQGISLNERHLFYYARELYYNNQPELATVLLKQTVEGKGWVENKVEACRLLYHIACQAGKGEDGIAYIAKALTLTSPKSEECCAMGEWFLSQKNYLAAKYWYLQALACNEDVSSGGFINHETNAFIPYLQLCVVYDRMGDYQTAAAYNQKAAAMRPRHPAVLQNLKYFKEKLGEST